MEGGGQKHKSYDMAVLNDPACNTSAQLLEWREQQEPSRLFSRIVSGSGSNDLLIAWWKILYHWDTASDNTQNKVQSGHSLR